MDAKDLFRALMQNSLPVPAQEAMAIALENGYPPNTKEPIEKDVAQAMSRTMESKMMMSSFITPEFWTALGKGLGWDDTGVMPESHRRSLEFINFQWSGYRQEPRMKDSCNHYFAGVLNEWRAKQKEEAEERGS